MVLENKNNARVKTNHIIEKNDYNNKTIVLIMVNKANLPSIAAWVFTRLNRMNEANSDTKKNDFMIVKKRFLTSFLNQRTKYTMIW